MNVGQLLVPLGILLGGGALLAALLWALKPPPEEPAEARRPWPRFLHTPGGGDAVLSWYVPGRFRDERVTLPRRYRSEGAPAGIEVDRVQGLHFWAEDLAVARALAERPELRGLVENMPQCMRIQGRVKDPATLDYLRDLIGIAMHALDSGGVCVVDMHTARIWSAAEWRDKVWRPGWLIPDAHVSLTQSDDPTAPERMWLRTRGMRLFGRPDLSLHGVSREYVDDISRAAWSVVQRMMQGAQIPDREPFRALGLPLHTAWFHVGSPSDLDFRNTRLELQKQNERDAAGLCVYRSEFDSFEAQGAAAGGEHRVPREEWMRPQYRSGGGDATVDFVLYGRFEPGPHELPVAYSSGGLAPGLLSRVVQNDPSWRAVPGLLSVLTRAGLADEVERAPNRLRLQGTVKDPDSLEYLRDLLGIISYHLDHGGVVVVDEQSGLVWSAERWKNQGKSGRLRIAELVQPVRAVEPGDHGKLCVQTRGMRLFGRPDVRLRNVPAQKEATTVRWLWSVAERMMRGSVIAAGERANADELFREGTWRSAPLADGVSLQVLELQWPDDRTPGPMSPVSPVSSTSPTAPAAPPLEEPPVT